MIYEVLEFGRKRIVSNNNRYYDKISDALIYIETLNILSRNHCYIRLFLLSCFPYVAIKV